MNVAGTPSANYTAALWDSSVSVAGCVATNTSYTKEGMNAVNVEAVIMATAILVCLEANTCVLQNG
jgi:hypothetical protein